MFIASHSLKDSLKYVLMNTEISAIIPKKGEKTMGYYENMCKDIHKNMSPNQCLWACKIQMGFTFPCGW